MEHQLTEFQKHALWLKNSPQDTKKKLVSKIGKNNMLQIYAHVRQGKDGDNTTPKPGMFAIKDKMKWTAWTKLKGMDKEAAKTKFVALLKDAIGKAGL